MVLKSFINYIEKQLNRFYVLLFILIFIVTSLIFLFSPDDYQQGEYVKIMYIHVPSAWMSLIVYSFMSLCSIIYMVSNRLIFSFIARSASYFGLFFAISCVVTGSIWGKFIWGAWWVWDARLTSMMILTLLYFGYVVANSSLEDNEQKDKILSIINLIGCVNIPIIKFSVDIWTTLHQSSSIIRKGGISIELSMLLLLLSMFALLFLCFLFILVVELKSYIYERRILYRLYK